MLREVAVDDWPAQRRENRWLTEITESRVADQPGADSVATLMGSLIKKRRKRMRKKKHKKMRRRTRHQRRK